MCSGQSMKTMCCVCLSLVLGEWWCWWWWRLCRERGSIHCLSLHCLCHCPLEFYTCLFLLHLVGVPFYLQLISFQVSVNGQMFAVFICRVLLWLCICLTISCIPQCITLLAFIHSHPERTLLDHEGCCTACQVHFALWSLTAIGHLFRYSGSELVLSSSPVVLFTLWKLLMLLMFLLVSGD